MYKVGMKLRYKPKDEGIKFFTIKEIKKNHYRYSPDSNGYRLICNNNIDYGLFDVGFLTENCLPWEKKSPHPEWL